MKIREIERKESGYLLAFGGFIEADEMQKWYDESKAAMIQETSDSFGVIVDMRTLSPLPENAQKIMIDGQKLYKDKGMQRSAVVLNNAVTTSQFKRLAKESGIYAWERDIDAFANPDWMQTAIDWVTKGMDPDIN